MVGGGHKEMLHKIIFLGTHGHFALTAPVLGGIKGDGITFNIATAGNGDHHVLFGNEVFNIYITGTLNDASPSFIGKLFLQGLHLLMDNPPDHLITGEDFLEPGNIFLQCRILFLNLIPFKAGEALEAHV